jgi:hypothetical protein
MKGRQTGEAFRAVIGNDATAGVSTIGMIEH